jgi:hypothetical protein
MNAAVRRLRTERLLPQSARPRAYIGLALTKEDHQGESGEGKRGNNMATPEWKPNKSYKLGDRVTIRYEGQASLLLCMEPGWSGLRPPAILRAAARRQGMNTKPQSLESMMGAACGNGKLSNQVRRVTAHAGALAV